MKLKDPTLPPALSRSVGHVDTSSAHRAGHLTRDCGCFSSARKLLPVLLQCSDANNICLDKHVVRN